jgi:hypothetical protein
LKQLRETELATLDQEAVFMSQTGISNNETSNMIKDPDDWKTGDEEMTGAQRSYLQTLAEEAGEEVDPNLTKAEASKRIEELQQKTGRGIDR